MPIAEADKPVEIKLFDYLTAKVTAAADGDVIKGLELHDTVYQTIKTTRVVRISDAVGDMAPMAGGGMQEFDVGLTIACLVKLEGTNQKARQPALISVFQLQRAVTQLLIDDQTLGDRVCNSVVKKGVRGYDELKGQPYAVAHIFVVINPTGGSQ